MKNYRTIISVAMTVLVLWSGVASGDEQLIYDAGSRKFVQNLDLNWKDSVTLILRDPRCAKRYIFSSERKQIKEVAAVVRGDLSGFQIPITGLPVGFGLPDSKVSGESLELSIEEIFADMLSGANGIDGIKSQLDEEWRSIHDQIEDLTGPSYQELLRRLNRYSDVASCYTNCFSGQPEFERIRGNAETAIREIYHGRKTTCEDLERIVHRAEYAVNRTVNSAAQVEAGLEKLDAENLISDFKKSLQSQRDQVLAFRAKVDRARRAAKNAERLLGYEREGKAADSEPLMRRFDVLSTDLKDKIGPKVLQNLANRTDTELTAMTDRLRDLLDWYPASPDRYESAVSSLKKASKDMDGLLDGFTQDWRETRAQVSAMLQALDENLLTYYEAGDKNVDVFQGEDNEKILVTAHEQITLQVPSSFELLPVVTLPAEEIASPEPGSEVATIVVDSSKSSTGQIFFRKKHRFNIGGGFVYSNLEEPGYDLRASKEDSDDLVLMQTSTSEDTTKAALFVSMFIPPLDLSTPKRARRLRFGPAIGFGFDNPVDNIFIGGFVQPFVGIQITAGAHFGTIRLPKDDITLGETIVDSLDSSLQNKRETNYFISLGFDIGFFRDLFETKASQ